MWMHQKIHSEYWPAKILYHVGEKEALLGWVSVCASSSPLYILYHPYMESTVKFVYSGHCIS